MKEKNNYQLKITIGSYEARTADETARLVWEQLSQLKLKFKGPHPFPNHRSIRTVPISPHKHKDAQEKFERIVHWRKVFVLVISPTIFKKLEEDLKAKVPHTAYLELRTFF